MNSNKNLSKNLIKYRKMRRLTQKQLAEKSAVSETHIRNIEQGRANVTLTLLDQLAHALEVDPFVLIQE